MCLMPIQISNLPTYIADDLELASNSHSQDRLLMHCGLA
jgi:hypothetical protein